MDDPHARFGNTHIHYSYILSLAGGILILVGSLALTVFLLATLAATDAEAQIPAFLQSPGRAWGLVFGLGAWGVLMGIIVILGSLRLRDRPHGSAGWGLVIVIAGALSIPVMGGFLFGAGAAILGGLMAVVSEDNEQVYRGMARGGAS